MSSSFSVKLFIPGPHIQLESLQEEKTMQNLGPLLLWEFYRDHYSAEISGRLRKRGISDLSLLTTYLRFHERTPTQTVYQVTRKLLYEIIRLLKEDPERVEKMIPGLYDYFLKSISSFTDQWFQVIDFCRKCNHLKTLDFIKKIIEANIEIPEEYAHLRPNAFVFADGDSPVHKYLYSIKEISRLVDMHFSPNIPNIDGETPLQLACGRPEFYKETVKLLIAKGGNPTKTTDNIDCFQRLFEHVEKPRHRIPLIKLFLSYGFKPNFIDNCPNYEFQVIRILPSDYILKGYYLLNGGKTFERTFNDPFPDDVIYGNVGEVQGHPEFRSRAAQADPRLFHPFVFPNFQHMNPVIYQKIVVKWFAHNLSLKMQPEDSSYEGFNESFTIPMFASAINYLKNLGNIFNKNEWHWIYTKINEAIFFDKINLRTELPEKYVVELSRKLQTLGYEDLILVGTGYDWHFKGWIFFGDFAIYVNRQRHNGHQKGEHIYIYYVPERNLLTPEILLIMIERYKQRVNTHYNQDFLIKKLKLQLVGTHLVHPQKTGNCTLSNLKGLSLTILAIKYLIKYIKPTSPESLMNNAPWIFSFNAVTPSYKILTKQVREDSTALVVIEVDRLLSKTYWPAEELSSAIAYYNVLLYAAVEFSGESLDAPLVKRLSPDYRRLIWDRIIKLGKVIDQYDQSKDQIRGDYKKRAAESQPSEKISLVTSRNNVVSFEA